MMGKLTVGVWGGTGHTAREMCRLLLGHPEVGSILPASRQREPFELVHPNLAGSGLELLTPRELAERAGQLDAVFLCAPAGEAMRAAADFRQAGVRVIDLGADFRFRDPNDYQRVYGREHTAPQLLGEAVYGVTEFNRPRIAQTALIANPGCFAITAILALTPLLRAGRIAADRAICVHAVNGTTGAGSTPKSDLMHAEVSGSMLAYSLEGHRHGPEVEQFLGDVAGRPVTVDFNTAHGNFARGIHLQANVPLAGPATRDDLLGLYTGAYGAGSAGEYFVLVNTLPKTGERNAKQYEIYPRLRNVVGSNFCHLGLDCDTDRGIAKIVAVTDNLVKGAAGSAIQNMNLMFGFDETCGLRAYAL
jgi:N-acetyl-gamma-glutamyl-phosphate reductase common form